VETIRVPWSTASFLAYLGGFTILFATAALLGVEANDQGPGGFVLWAALTYCVLTALAFLARATGHRVVAGLLALTSVVAFAVFVGALLDWFGWLEGPDSPFEGFNFWLLVLELLTLLAALATWRTFRFPLLLLAVAATAWFFVTDLISNGGNWSAIVTIAVGLALLMAAVAADAGESRANGFWLHVVSGLTIGGGLLWFFHDGDLDWILVGIAGLAYIAFGDRLARSSWVVLGAWGLLQTAAHFADKWSSLGEIFFTVFYLFTFVFSSDSSFGETHEHQWLGPIIFAALGALFFVIAVALARRRRETIPGAELI
jgi:hypothetical protein